MLRTSCAVDTHLELVEMDSERERLIDAAKDSAADDQAQLVHELVVGPSYVVRVPTIYAEPWKTVAFWLE